MFKNIKTIKDMLKRLKEDEGITPSYEQFVKAIKDNPRFISMFHFDDEYFKQGAIYELALAIRMIRGYW
ncbi:MAG: hypothetical protein IKL08_05155 [Clostridia bacterium]|nr:hypothetical protein [Clostridia bacterium]